MVGDRLVIGMADAKRAPAARAALMASALEEGLRREGPGPWIRAHRFFALLVHAEHAKPRDVIAAILDFARPALKHSKLPEELVAWSVTVGDWHVVYYYSLPDPHAWQEGEEQMVRFGDLPAYLHVARDEGDPAWDAVVVAEPGDDGALRVINKSHSDFDGETVWGLVERTTGLTLEALQQAIGRGEPSWLVHMRTVVSRGR